MGYVLQTNCRVLVITDAVVYSYMYLFTYVCVHICVYMGG